MPLSDDDLSQIDLNLLVVFAALERRACLVRAGHPITADPDIIAGRPPSIDACLAWPHVAMTVFGDWTNGHIARQLRALGKSRQVAIQLPYFSVAPLLVETSDALLILPHRAAKRFAEAHGLVMFDAPEVFGTFDRREVWNGQSGGPVIGGNGDPVERPDGSMVDREDAALSHEGRWGWGITQLHAYTEVSKTGDDGIRQEDRVVEGNAALPFDYHTLVVGGEARWIELNSGGEFTSGGAETDAQALYVQDEFRLTDTVKLLAGARLDEDRYFGTHVTPRGYAVWTPTPAVTVKGGVSTGFKAPTLRQLSPDSRVMSDLGGCVILGNPDLQPEASVNDDFSAGYDTGDWGATVTLFRNDIENLIDTPRGSGVDPIAYDPATGNGIYRPVNINEARIEGIEASGYAMLWDWGRASANWTWLDARNEMTGAVLDNRPKHVLNGKVDWFVSDEVMAYTRATHTGRQRSGTLTLDPSTLVDVGVDWQINDAISVRGGVLNLADTSTGDPDDDYAYVERGRTVFVGASARF